MWRPEGERPGINYAGNWSQSFHKRKSQTVKRKINSFLTTPDFEFVEVDDRQHLNSLTQEVY